MKTIYSDYEFEDTIEAEIEFDSLFNNEWECKGYVVFGDIGLWDGPVENFNYPNAYDSIKSAILVANRDFGGYIEVKEGKYGKMFLTIGHHDGTNYLEIKELSELGMRLLEKNYSIKRILKRKGTTKNIRYCKTYLGE